MGTILRIRDRYTSVKEVYDEWIQENTILIREGDRPKNIVNLWEELLSLSVAEEPWEMPDSDNEGFNDALKCVQ